MKTKCHSDKYLISLIPSPNSITGTTCANECKVKLLQIIISALLLFLQFCLQIEHQCHSVSLSVSFRGIFTNEAVNFLSRLQ